ncbi:MAG TPA: hypothetical protein VF818_00380 [Ktedonobacterales bacterium]
MLPIVLAALLGLSALAVVLAPLYAAGRHHAPPDGVPATALADREAAAKAALRDVEFDHQLGNLADDDYRTLRERYTRRALAALKGRYDHERALDEAIEAQVRALRAGERGPGAAKSGEQAGGTTSAAPRRSGQNGHRSPRSRGNGARGDQGRGRS